MASSGSHKPYEILKCIPRAVLIKMLNEKVVPRTLISHLLVDGLLIIIASLKMYNVSVRSVSHRHR